MERCTRPWGWYETLTEGEGIWSSGCGWNLASDCHCSAISTGLSTGTSQLVQAW